jgi:hypothetical protein
MTSYHAASHTASFVYSFYNTIYKHSRGEQTSSPVLHPKSDIHLTKRSGRMYLLVSHLIDCQQAASIRAKEEVNTLQNFRQRIVSETAKLGEPSCPSAVAGSP